MSAPNTVPAYLIPPFSIHYNIYRNKCYHPKYTPVGIIIPYTYSLNFLEMIFSFFTRQKRQEHLLKIRFPVFHPAIIYSVLTFLLHRIFNNLEFIIKIFFYSFYDIFSTLTLNLSIFF